MTKDTLSISEVQREITRLPEQLEAGPEAITVTRHGKPVLAILPIDTYKELKEAIDRLQETVDALQETLEILQDDELMADFRQGVKELEEGKGELLDDVLKELGWE